MQQRNSSRSDDDLHELDSEWEVFVRDDAEEPLIHVGSVTADTESQARSEAKRHFDWFAMDIWLCPADAVSRYPVESRDIPPEA